MEKIIRPNDQLIRAKIIAQLLRHSPSTLIASQGVACLTYLVLKPESKDIFIHGWIIIFVLIFIARTANAIIERNRFDKFNIESITRRYQVGAFCGGLMWAVLIFAYDPTASQFAQLFLLVTLVGMPAASLASNAFYFPIFLTFATPILMSLMIWSVFLSQANQLAFFLMASIYSILIIYVAKQYSTNIKHSIEREEENKILVREIKAVNLQLQKLAYEDPLTKLSNRRQFEENAELLLLELDKRATSLILMLLDIDNFKTVNDTFGHEVGDSLLKEISDRIKVSSRQSELIAQSHAESARIGGDEFVIMYDLNTKDIGVHELAKRILHTITQPVLLGDKTFKPSVSIGIAIAPKHARHIKELLRIADFAMYRAKEAGGDQFMIANKKDQKKNR